MFTTQCIVRLDLPAPPLPNPNDPTIAVTLTDVGIRITATSTLETERLRAMRESFLRAAEQIETAITKNQERVEVQLG